MRIMSLKLIISWVLMQIQFQMPPCYEVTDRLVSLSCFSPEEWNTFMISINIYPCKLLSCWWEGWINVSV